MFSQKIESMFGAGETLSITLGDLDGDGDLDAVMANGGNVSNTVLLNDGSGLFVQMSDRTLGVGHSFDIALGDLDGDGDLDAVLANFIDEPNTVWLNEHLASVPVERTTTGNETTVLPQPATADSYVLTDRTPGMRLHAVLTDTHGKSMFEGEVTVGPEGRIEVQDLGFDGSWSPAVYILQLHDGAGYTGTVKIVWQR
jgi:hypothetical protein